jgi:hypothetical protein
MNRMSTVAVFRSPLSRHSLPHPQKGMRAYTSLVDQDGAEARRKTVEWLQSHDPFNAQSEYGDDLSLLRENLKLTPTERFLKYERAARLALEVFNAGKRAGLHRKRLNGADMLWRTDDWFESGKRFAL